MFHRLGSLKETDLPQLTGSDRGLLLAHQLSDGHRQAYPARALTDTPGKAVAFALPTRSGSRLTFPPLPLRFTS